MTVMTVAKPRGVAAKVPEVSEALEGMQKCLHGPRIRTC